MSNVSTGALELCFFSGSTPSILPTMLGGSAPSQTSGAPYRTESDSRVAAWPAPAHQNELCNRGYGVYSLFPGPGDTPRTLYTPTAKSHSSNFQDFVDTQKVPEGLFSNKFAFVSKGTPEFDSVPHLGIETKVPHTELTPKSFTQVSKPYSPTGKKSEEQNGGTQEESEQKRLSSEVVIIKTEMEERMQRRNSSTEERQCSGEVDLSKNNKKRKNVMPQTESEPVRVGDVLASEPDSTEFKVLNETSEDVTTSEMDFLEKDSVDKGLSHVNHPVDILDSNEVIENCSNGEKCNIKVIESVNGSDGKNRKKTDKFPVKAESVNDICCRLTEKKYVKEKTADSNYKTLATPNKKFYNETSKPSPIRTLSLSPQNGGCSRTTPVTFKQTAQQETDPKPQNIHIEVPPPLFIKKEPSDFLKNSNGTPFLSPAHHDNNFFSPGGLSLLDGQLLSPMPFSSGFESSNRQKENFLNPLDQNFLSPGQPFLSPRPVAESPFLSPPVDFNRYSAYKNYPTLPKPGGEYLINGTDGKIPEEVFLKNQKCVPPKNDKHSEDGRAFVNSTSAESRARFPESNICSGSNMTPCQVAEVTSASSLLSPKHSSVNPLVVKQESTSVASSSGSSAAATSVDQNKETTFITSGQSTLVSSTVGMSSTRQRCHQRVNEIKMLTNSVPSPPVMHRTIKSPAPIDLPPAMGTAVFAGGMMDDRSANLITTWPAPTHNPTLWQYSAPIDYPPFPPVGFQLVRDPITGHFLLIPASNLEALQRAILWPSYQSTPPQMIIPPLSVQPSTPHLILDTNVPAVDFLTSETIHHNGPQHRILISSENASKRKINTPTVIKLEASDCSNPVVVTTCENNNIYSKTQPPSLSPRKETVFHSQKTIAMESGRRSQATSPCLTPVLDSLATQSDSRDSDSFQLQRTATVTLQDASNQTDLPFERGSEECTSSVSCKDKFEPYTRTTGRNLKTTRTQDVATETVLVGEPRDDKSSVKKEILKKKEIEKSLSINCADVPGHLNIKKEIISPSQVDLSGLELLSNSIEQFVCDIKCKNIDSDSKIKTCASDEVRKDLSNDACEGAVLLQNLRNGFREVDESETFDTENSKNLGGLGLLCALAEQRFNEEIGKEVINKENTAFEEEEEEESTKEESKEMLISELDCLNKKDSNECDLDSYHEVTEQLPVLKKELETVNESSTPTGNKKILKKKYKGDVSPMRKFPNGKKSIFKRKPGRPKKFKNIRKDNSVLKSFFSGKNNRNSIEMSPPILEKETDFSFNEKSDPEDSMTMNSKDVLKPPTLIPSTILDPVIKTMAGTLELTPCEVNLIALKFGSENLKKHEENTESEGSKRKLSDSKISSSKKRKVGRPKKHHLLHESSLTETIVAKKPKTKPFLFSPVQTVENVDILKTKNENPTEESGNKKNVFVKLEVDETNFHEEEEPEEEDDDNEEEQEEKEKEKEKEKKSKKIRPKLKAEPKVKEWSGMADDEPSERRKILKKEEGCKHKTKTQKKVVIDGNKLNLGLNGTKETSLPSCLLTTEHLKSDKFPIRTLTAMGGLFYAGQLSAIRPPDVYGITIDGERGNRPHIYSREEILKDSILEVKADKTSDLPPGTRCCAYWSEQYRCLYPGTVSAPVSPDPELDDKFVNVEFDDGDSGKINIDDIRLLPEDYPIVEYDPNPLQSLCKRKRRISGASVESHSKERKSIDSLTSPEKSENVNQEASPEPEPIDDETEPKKPVHVYEQRTFLSLESERRHLKKKRREKLKRLQSLSIEGKRKHKKHKCSEEHRHHRHHKKHRKHKHKHGKRRLDEVRGDIKKGESSESSSKDKEEFTVKKKAKTKSKSVENNCKLSEKSKTIKAKKCKKRTESVESRSKMAAFLPARQLWGWSGKGFRRPGAKGRARKEFYKTIERGKERITVGDCAVFLSTGRPDRPYIGRIESMWESWGTNMIVRVKWFYHPEETVGCPATLEYPGALFESPHVDENDVQTISHKCEVLPLKEYTAKMGNDPHRYETIYDNNDIYYLAGYYDPTNTTLKMEPGVK